MTKVHPFHVAVVNIPLNVNNALLEKEAGDSCAGFVETSEEITFGGTAEY